MADESHDVSYHRLLAACRQRETHDTALRAALDDLAAKVDFGEVRSCLAFGTGSGEREMELARRLLPNLRSFTAVEPDTDSVRALRANLDDPDRRLLPAGVVETSVVHSSIENWIGGAAGSRHRFDVVLLLGVLFHVDAADRKALFGELATRRLRPGALVVIFDYVVSPASGWVALLERFGALRDDCDAMEAEMVAAGFRVVCTRDVELRYDYADPSDGLVKFARMMIGHDRCSESQVRAAIDDIWSRPNMDVQMAKLAAFAK